MTVPPTRKPGTNYADYRYQLRRTGRLGAEFASLLREHYASTPLIAFSEGADEFWESIGWIYYPRKDGDIHYRKLFISERISS
ncbi:GCN5-like N-acetyltransferase (fragment) [Corynebacterium striatum]